MNTKDVQTEVSEEYTPKPRMPNKLWTVGTLSYTTGGLTTLFAWLLWGDLTWSVRDRIIPPVMQILFKKYGASDTLAGLLISSVPLAIGLFVCPIIGYMSDRHRGRWGRRIPYLFYSTPVIVISILGLAFSPQIGMSANKLIGHSLDLNLFILFFIGLFWLLFEFACGIANMIFGGLVNDVVPPTVVGRFFGLFRAISLIVGIIFNFWMFGSAETYYIWIFIGIGVLYGAGFSMMCLKVKEGRYPPTSPLSQGGLIKQFLSATKIYLKESYGHSYYLYYFAATILVGLATIPVSIYTIFYAISINMSMATYGRCYSLSFAISLCLAYPLGALVDRFHPLRMTIVALGLYMGAMLWGGLYAKDVSTYAIALSLHCIFAGTLITVFASLPQRLLPRDKFAQIGTAGGIAGSLIGIIFAPGLGLFLDYTHHIYRYTFYIGFVVTAMAFLMNLILYQKFKSFGGPANYVAPCN